MPELTAAKQDDRPMDMGSYTFGQDKQADEAGGQARLAGQLS